AKAYEQVTLAKAERDARIAGAEANRQEVELDAAGNAQRVKLVAGAAAEAVRARGLAEAEAIKARADALAENQDAVIGQQLAENWPSIVEAAARPFGDIDQMIVLNGAQGLSDALAQALSQGVTGLQMARKLLDTNGGKSAREKA